ncbi:NAD(P)/FAD-dependent oxidoreductase [Aspergillus stella-maris]|uniref:NAD(P)/FAD-dependent oxidoreductase n=1 Tax=Aspergillus stella-maris TaxID=1810926 RepID=UPI003CCDDF01
MSQQKTLILGAGIFGVSTALHLARVSSSPEEASRITILDRAPFPENSQAASADINKIIRADYSSPLYMELGFEAIHAWKNDPVLNPVSHSNSGSGSGAVGGKVYTQSGWIALDEKGSDVPVRIRQNFKDGGYDSVITDMTETQVRQNWGGVLSRTDLSPFGSYYYNPSAGWADASGALRLMLTEAIRLGVKYEVGEVKRVLLNTEDGKGVSGVETETGTILRAEKVLLATGAWTSAVMSSLENELGLPEDDRVEKQVSAAGVCVAHFQLSEEEKAVYDELPVLVYGGQGEVIPPTESGILKFTSSTSFKNTTTTPSGQNISIPVPDQTITPQGLQKDLISAVRSRLPQLLDANRKPDFYRLCWDSISSSQHPLITRHPDTQLNNLYFAVGGSFHFYKFLPTIGKYVVNVLGGVSNGDVKDKAWGWKPAVDNERGVHASLIPKHEFRDFV